MQMQAFQVLSGLRAWRKAQKVQQASGPAKAGAKPLLTLAPNEDRPFKVAQCDASTVWLVTILMLAQKQGAVENHQRCHKRAQKKEESSPAFQQQ